MKKFTLISLALVFSVLGSRGEELNLLRNADFNDALGESVTSWIFPPSLLRGHEAYVELIERGEATSDQGDSCLRIAVTKPFKAHLWWQQEVEALPGSIYELKVRYLGRVTEEGDSQSYASPDIGVYFQDQNGKWIGYQRLQSAPGFDGEWHEVEMEVSVPDNAGSMGVRLGFLGNVAAEILFDQAALRFVE